MSDTYFKNYSVQAVLVLVLVIGSARFFNLEQKYLGWSFTDFLWNGLCTAVMAIPSMLNQMLHSI